MGSVSRVGWFLGTFHVQFLESVSDKSHSARGGVRHFFQEAWREAGTLSDQSCSGAEETVVLFFKDGRDFPPEFYPENNLNTSK